MTLILSCLTRDYVVQVSDRRVVATDGSWREDRANKAIFFCGHSSFSYTGIARLEGLPTDEWLTEQLGTAKALGDTLPLLQRRARDAVRAIPFPSSVRPSERPVIRRLAFVNVAFVLLGEPSADRTRYQLVRTDTLSEASIQKMQPVLTVVSNFFRPPDQWLAKAEREFTVFHRTLDKNEDSTVFPSGQRIGDEDYKELVRNVRHCVERSTTGYPTARILARQIQAVSKNNQKIGSNVLCSLIPRRAILSHMGQYPESGMIPSLSRVRKRIEPLYVPKELPTQEGLHLLPRILDVCGRAVILRAKLRVQRLDDQGRSYGTNRSRPDWKSTDCGSVLQNANACSDGTLSNCYNHSRVC